MSGELLEKDVYRIVDAGADAFAERRMALVGGQALLYWAHKYRETSYLEGHALEPLASRDVDFTASADEADAISKAIGGRVVVSAKKFDPNVTNAVVVFTDDDGDEHKIDFIKVPLGISESLKEFLRKVVPVEWDSHAMLVMNPWQILRSRLANLEHLATHRGEHSQAQAKAAIACMLAFTHELIEVQGQRAALKVIADLKAYLFGNDTPKKVWREFGIDAREALHPPCEHLPDAYREKEYPFAMAQLDKKWS